MNSRNSVAGIIRENGFYLIAKRLSGGALGEKWEFPGGKQRHDESAEEALKREFLEELEVEITVGKKLSETDFVHKNTKFTVSAYDVTLLSDKLTLNMHSEIRRVQARDIKEADMAPSDWQLFLQFR